MTDVELGQCLFAGIVVQLGSHPTRVRVSPPAMVAIVTFLRHVGAALDDTVSVVEIRKVPVVEDASLREHFRLEFDPLTLQ